MVKSIIQTVGAFIACFAACVIVVAMQPDPQWKIEPQSDGTVKHSLEDAKGDWIEIKYLAENNQLVRHHYRDWQYRVHHVRYDANTGEQLEHRVVE